MAFESEYVPEQTPRLSSLSSQERRIYKKIVWGLFGFYTAIVIVGVVVICITNVQKSRTILW